MNQNQSKNFDSSLSGNTSRFPAINTYCRSRLYTSNTSINPLVAACDQILNLATIITTSDHPEDYEKLLNDLAHEIRSFEHQAQISNYQNSTIIDARLALCHLLDECIKSTDWGESNWLENNLSNLFHNGECYDTRLLSIINNSLENISANLHLIELLYLCLNLNPKTNKHKPLSDEQQKLETITNKLYQIIIQHNQFNHKSILIQDKETGEETNISTAKQKSKNKGSASRLLWTTAIFSLVVSIFIYSAINLKLNKMSKPTHSIIEQIISGNRT